MSVTMNVAKSQSLGGVSFPESKAPTGDAMIVHNLSIAAAEAGDLTTRTSDTIGTLTVDDSGHSITTGVRLDIYWTAGTRRGVLVGIVSGSSIPFTGGAGDVLPTNLTAITCAVPEEADVFVDGTNVAGILLYSAARGIIVLEDDGALEAYEKRLGAGITAEWHEDNGIDNPITGDAIEKAYFSQEGIVAGIMRLGILYDNA